MNLASTLQTEGYNAQKSVSAEGFVLFDSNKKFTAILEPLPSVVAQMELGNDVREAARLHILRSDCPADLLKADATSQVRITQVDTGATWKTATRNDNPADIEAVFTVVKKVTGQDS